jgi:mRNA interferase MazF
VTVASTGDSGEPAAALVIQPDFFTEVSTATVLLISSERVNSPLFRIDIAPTSENGLEKPSQIMIDKIFTVRRENLGRAIGRIGDDTLLAVNRALAVFLGLG